MATAAALDALAKQLAAVDEFELEVELAQPELEEVPARVPLGLIKKASLGDEPCQLVPRPRQNSSGSMSTRRSSGVFDFEEDEPAPRRATHDGTHGRVGSTAPSASPAQNAPASEPRLRRSVRWAPDVQSPRKSRQALHKRARESERHPEPQSWGELPSGAKRSRKEAPKLKE